MKLNFEKYSDGLLPVVVQDNKTNTVLMLGFMNQEAYQKTIAEKNVTFFSRSKKRLWTKGETSGNYLSVVSIIEDCDQDTLLIKAIPHGPVCHTGKDTCFGDKNDQFDLHTLEQIIKDRKFNPTENSYTSSLFAKGINKIAQKVGEEAIELVIESKDDSNELFLGEAADLLFHYLILLQAKNTSLTDVIDILRKRHKA